MSHELASQHHQIKVERTEILYNTGLSATLGSVAAALITTALIWKYTHHETLIIWITLVCIVSGIRLVLVLRFNQKPPTEDKISKWDRAYFISAIAAGSSWGLLSFVEVNSTNMVFQLIPFLVIAFVLMAAIPSYSASLKSYFAFLFSLVAVTIIGRYYLKSPYSFLIDIIFIIYSPVLYATAKSFNNNLTTALGLKHQQTQLVKQIKTSNAQLKYANKQLLQKQQIIDQESQFAQHVFTQLTDNLIDQIPQIRIWLKSLDTFSGDLIQTTISTTGKHYLFLGDFTGHGLPAALGAVPASSIFNAMAKKDKPIEEIAAELCNKLYRLLPVNYFCCASLMEINPETGAARALNAGLPAILQIDKKGQISNLINSTNVPLGIAPCEAEIFNVISLQSQIDDCYYLYSDGITEAENASREMWGDLNFQKSLQTPLSDNSRLETIKQQLTDFVQQTPLTDDISILEYHVTNPNAD
ncbi:MAG TPA: serine/threonine-protein phosphatase [Aeromonadales bacterium]|nr:serine/threonine-protein phosphatase [Aeromonadales bacterium]